MFKSIKKYNDYFNSNNTEGIVKKIFFDFMIILHHLVSSLILIIIFSEYWIGIIFMGMFFPDIYYALYSVFIRLFPQVDPDLTYSLINLSIKSISHILTFFVVVILVFNNQTVLALAGGIHLLEDMMGL